MKKWMLFSGVGILILGAVLVYFSGIMTGLLGSQLPVYPVLYSMQLLWTLLAAAGIALIIAGAVFKNKKKTKKE